MTRRERPVSGLPALAVTPEPRRDEIGALVEGCQRRARLEDAVAFLRALLVGGPVPALVVQRVARGAGISERTLWRAKQRLGALAIKTGSGAWVWTLPEGCQPSEGCQPEDERPCAWSQPRSPDGLPGDSSVPCRLCGGRTFARHRAGGPFVCSRCHPMAPEVVAETHEVGGAVA